MPRIPYIRLLAILFAVCLIGQTALTFASAIAAPTPSINKAELSKAVQEALAKRSGAAGGGQGAAGAAGLPGSAGSAGSAGTSEGLGTSGALSSLTKGGGEEEAIAPTSPTASTSSSSSGVSTSVLLPIFIVGAILLGGIAFFIVRDARSVAPVGDALAGGGSAQDRAARLRKRRAKAKAARRQRKRNR
jgi:cobalamin biosynthesis Mg chelatase CobN